MQNIKKLLALVLALVMVAALFAGCDTSTTDSSNVTPTSGSNGDTDATSESESGATSDTSDSSTTIDTTEPEETYEVVKPEDLYGDYIPSGKQAVNGKTYGENGDYWSLYAKYGKDASIADVTEDPATGLAYFNAPDGKSYELGMDFLSMAMVYNTNPEGTEFSTADDVYAAWWKYYMTRWNYLLPEIPLYSNEYYDVYNSKLKGVQDHPTNPFWNVARALVEWTSDDNKIILGSSTQLSGKFRMPNFGQSSRGASDADIYNLTNGLGTVAQTKEGAYEFNKTAVKSAETTENADGTLTYTFTLHEDLKFSDGSPITAKNYLYQPMAFSTPVGAEAASRDHKTLMNYVGYSDFASYDGTEGSGSKVMAGLRLLGDYQFSVTVSDEFGDYYYAILYADFGPSFKGLWAGECDLQDDGEGVYWTDDFYAKDGEHYKMADHLKASADNTDTSYPYSGAYVVESFDTAETTATLKINPNYKGNYDGAKPSIETVVYKRVVADTQLEDLKAGGVDVLSGITGGNETNEAIKMADESNGKFDYIHYARAGYGKLGFRADYGPVQFPEVRRAIAYCMDRATFAKDFTGGYGGVVDGAYYAGSWMYKAATAQGMLLESYDTSVDSAIEVLEEGGWIYDKDGNEYVSGVRYKKIPAEYATEYDKKYHSFDNEYKTTEVNGDYYMPLVLNWFGTSENVFSDLLVTGFETSENILGAGFKVYKNLGEFQPMLDELMQQAVYGYYSGEPVFCCFNFATSFNPAYSYDYNMTIDPDMYEDMQAYYNLDLADIYWN